MKTITLYAFCFFIIGTAFSSIHAQDITNATYIGTYKSAKINYGKIYQFQRDTVNADAVNYMGGIYFRVVANMFEILGNVR